jgi:hypothetical protein
VEAISAKLTPMPRFLVLYRSPMSPREMMANASPEEMKAGMEAWMGWANDVGPALADFGAPLDAAQHFGAGPASTADNVVGYSFLEGDSAEAVGGILQRHPHLSVDGNSIDVLELLPTPGT